MIHNDTLICVIILSLIMCFTNLYLNVNYPHLFPIIIFQLLAKVGINLRGTENKDGHYNSL